MLIKILNNSQEKKMWNAYESHWNEFIKRNNTLCSLTAEQVPLPINYNTFLFHMRAILESTHKLEKSKNNKELWIKVKNEALRRYHPDKFSHNFERWLKSEEDKQILLRHINQICQVLNTKFKI